MKSQYSITKLKTPSDDSDAATKKYVDDSKVDDSVFLKLDGTRPMSGQISIVPSITYCIAVWGSCSLSLFNDLEHLHIKAAKLIHKLPSGTPDCDALKRAKWKPLSYIYKRRLASIMYQVHNDILPVQLTALLGTRSNETSYKLRRSNDFSLVRYHSELGRNSIRYRYSSRKRRALLNIRIVHFYIFKTLFFILNFNRNVNFKSS